MLYLDMVKELLSENDFCEFEKLYMNPVHKSVKIISNRGIKGNDNLHDIIENILSGGWNIVESNFSYMWNKYCDVEYALKKSWCTFSSLWSHWLHQAWLIYVQEMAAGLSVQVLWVQKTDIVLDMCAAPWWKTIQIADKAKFVISNEVDSWRIKALKSNLHRCGIYNVWVIQNDWVKIGDMFPEKFDKVLVDAPCSWEWMQYKSDKKVWQWDESKSRKLAELQIQLVLSWFDALKVWWELVYSTCTTNPIENEYVVSEVKKKCWDDIELIEVPLDQKSKWVSIWRWNNLLSEIDACKVARLWPHIHQTGWFFIAKFRKKWLYKKEENKLISTQEDDLCVKAKEFLFKWWIELPKDIWMCLSKYTVNITHKQFISEFGGNNYKNMELWLPIFKVVDDARNNSKKLVPLVWLSQVFWNITKNCVIDVNDEQLKIIMEKMDLVDNRFEQFEGSYVVIRWNEIGVWLVSVQRGIWKNKTF